MTIFGEPYYRRAQVSTIGGLSAHAGQNTLLDYALNTRRSVKKIFLVHGEPRAQNALMEHMRSAGLSDVCAPEPFEEVELL